MFRDLSFRYKIPLRGTVLILITSFAITAALIFRAYDDLKQDLIANAEGLAGVMAHTLVPAILKDDIWHAFEIVRTPFSAAALTRSSLQAQNILIINNDNNIYVASDPERFQMHSPLTTAGAEFALLEQQLRQNSDATSQVLDLPQTEHLYVTTPIISDKVRLGTLVISYPREGFTPRFVRFAGRAAIATLIVLGALLPLSWYWGTRLADPLVKLAGCLGRIGRESPDNLHCDLYESKDEIGQVGTRFKAMLHELQIKQSLEQQVIATERLAAVGQLTASIAHEINNPLGGMLNTISTQKRYGHNDAMTDKTLALLERGLLQIKDTVSALLVEARQSSRDFGPEDMDDIRTLITPDIQRQQAKLKWDVRVGTVPLSASLIRQILINLLLNAVKATPSRGRVFCRVTTDTRKLVLHICNSGEPIPEKQMSHLFEPFVHYRADGNGLGLWVCYQIVTQLGGTIEAANRDDETCFTATIPIPS
ncbi:MAG: HAMP domain-containing histidine kinase [Gammaproteobacteria bacterium]|nr:HAMP domain-containing histidine kinase [Gammaproteobacteria bacterium]MCW8928187.1 HAMP domain-containing histidine kinase [Gammaproteobacteria bacterium]MCW8958548.1 HAMP domain-containing histidine kinase [Gammaproteobacteria bacterium]MCW8972423.1 HAMP domain-containing histidine kinase [Gammaproteobacteria bacterium]MCW8992227.1 HAMP domain-containing histidine kinase [Gammaproteobacteria bacterium]